MIALSDGRVIGTIRLMLKEKNCAILKKHNIFQHNSEKSIQSINITSEADV